MTKSAADVFWISRPRFWLYLGGTYLVGFAFGASSAASLATPLFVVHLLYFLIPANVFLYGINDLFDADTDQLNPKKGRQEHLLRARDRRPVAVAVTLSALIGVGLILAQSSLSAQVFFALFMILGAAYSAPPARLKARPFLDFSSNVLYAMPAFLAFAQASGTLPPLAAVVGAACWTGAMHLFSAVPDIEADRKARLQTTATVLGAPASLALCAVLWLVAALSAMALAIGYAKAGAASDLSAAIALTVSLAALVYPMVALAAWRVPGLANRVYWRFPYVNALIGFALFVAAASRWID